MKVTLPAAGRRATALFKGWRNCGSEPVSRLSVAVSVSGSWPHEKTLAAMTRVLRYPAVRL